MKMRVTLGVVALVLGLWFFLPDPLPVFVDDVIAGLGSAAALLGIIKSFVKKDNNSKIE